jgi:hypothetical protein
LSSVLAFCNFFFWLSSKPVDKIHILFACGLSEDDDLSRDDAEDTEVSDMREGVGDGGRLNSSSLLSVFDETLGRYK